MVLRYYFSSSVGGWTLVEAKLESTLLQLLEELYYRGIIPTFKLQLRTKEMEIVMIWVFRSGWVYEFKVITIFYIGQVSS